MHETHIEHSVGFIEHQNLDMPQIDMPLIHEIEQASGRSNDNIYPAMQRVRLCALLYAAKNNDAGEADMATVSLKTFIDLHSKFPRGRENEASNIPFSSRGGRPLRRLLQAVE